MKESKSFTALLAIALALALLTGAIAVPILCRPFYYAHIGPLGLEEAAGLTEEEIRTAFDEMLDYCQGGEEFSTGVLKWSDSGKSHFTDVRFLFLLDLQVLVCALALVTACLLLMRRGRHQPALPLGRGPAFWAGAGLGAVLLAVAALAALDFDRAFVVFHWIFFPGKDNWRFDPAADQIIQILPQEFFQNCALLILAVLAVGCAGLIVFDLTRKKGRGKIHSRLQKF